MKLTHVVFEFWGTYKYDCLKSLSWERYSYGFNEIKPLINLARSFGMEVIPMLNHRSRNRIKSSCADMLR